MPISGANLHSARLTRRERGLNLSWLVALTVPALGLAYSCIANAQSAAEYCWGISAAVIVFGALFYLVPRYSRTKPRRFLPSSFAPLFAAYIPGVIGFWQGGLSAASLLYPILLYAFVAGSGRLYKWAEDAAP